LKARPGADEAAAARWAKKPLRLIVTSRGARVARQPELAMFSRCADYFRQQGQDLTQYNTPNTVKDSILDGHLATRNITVRYLLWHHGGAVHF